jgi:stage III sporulation protein SpoIIIAA
VTTVIYTNSKNKFITEYREIARILADEREKRVIIVDTSNEIGGDGDVPHSGIGHARRMQVPKVTMQHDVSQILLYVHIDLIFFFGLFCDAVHST